MTPLRTEFSFTLPFGFPDERGTLQRDGTMRLATAIDEIEPLGDARVQANPAYVSVLLLARVINHIGEIAPVTTATVEGLFSADFAFLQELYLQVNAAGTSIIETACPSCDTHFALDLGGSSTG